MMEALRTTLTEFDTIYRKLRGKQMVGMIFQTVSTLYFSTEND
jgi:hypothetical protein